MPNQISQNESDRIYQSLLACPIFAQERPNEINQETMQALSKECRFLSFDAGDYIEIGDREHIEGIYLITRGCVAIESVKTYPKNRDVVLALVYPNQVFLELEYLRKIPLPKTVYFRAMSDTELILIPRRALAHFQTQHGEVLFRNLAVSFSYKMEADNLHDEAVSHSSGAKRIASMLNILIDLKEWGSNNNPTDNTSLSIPIIFSADFLCKYLNSSIATIAKGLKTLVELQMVEITWLDESLNVISGVELAEIGELNLNHRSKISEDTGFRIKVVDKQRLRKLTRD